MSSSSSPRLSVRGYRHAWPRWQFTYENQGRDFHGVGLSLGAPGADPLLSIWIDLGARR